jgi:hypothetical protein
LGTRQCDRADGVVICVGLALASPPTARADLRRVLSSRRGTKRMGVGLGLAIVKEVARLLGFAVRSTPRWVGTQAVLRIPNKRVASGSDCRPAAAHASGRSAQGAADPGRRQ